jgi:tetratricopeptide (TPR) repeat protein
MISDTIPSLNNNAITLFQNGHHDEAVANLKDAINHLIGRMGNACSLAPTISPRPMDEMVEDDMQTGCGTMQSRCEELSALTSLYSGFWRPVPVDKPLTTRECDISSMYSSAAILLESCHERSSSDNVNQTSVVLLYNLAFVHHWRAVHMGISKGLPKALKLYDMALEIIRSKSTEPDMASLGMAIWNNKGHIHAQLFQLHEAQACFSRLRMMLLSQREVLCLLPKKDYETFLLSAMFQGSELHLAPAA